MSSKGVSASQSHLGGTDPPGAGPQGVPNPLALPQSFWEQAVGADLLIVVFRHVALSVVHHCYLLAIPGTESSSHQSQQPPRGLPGLRRCLPLLLGLPSCSAPPRGHTSLRHGELAPGLCPNQRLNNSGTQPRREARTSFFSSLAFLQLRWGRDPSWMAIPGRTQQPAPEQPARQPWYHAHEPQQRSTGRESSTDAATARQHDITAFTARQDALEEVSADTFPLTVW